MQIFKSLFTKPAPSRYMASAERDTIFHATQERIADVGCVVIGAITAAIFVSALAYATSSIAGGEKIIALAQITDAEQVALSLDTDSICNPGDHLAARFVNNEVKTVGCWMQPTEKTVSVRWMSATADDKVTFDGQLYRKSQFQDLPKASKEARLAASSIAKRGA
jgi:hypothetical protein